jgi:hypothetical protein
MSVMRCPGCHLPLTDEEAHAVTCPVCAAALRPDPPAAHPAQPPVARPASSLAVPVAVLATLATTAVAVVAVCAYLLIPPAPGQDTPHDKAAGTGVEEKKQARQPPDTKQQESAATIRPEKIPAPRVEVAEAPLRLTAERIPAPRVVVEPKPPPEKKPDVKVVAKEKPKEKAKVKEKAEKQIPGAGPGEVFTAKERSLNRPDGEYVLTEHQGGGKVLKVSGAVKTLRVGVVRNNAVLEITDLTGQELIVNRIDNHARIKASGKVKKLTIGSLVIGGTLDATQLEVEEVVVTGAMDNWTKLFLNGKVKTLHVGAMNIGAALEALGLDAREITFAKRLDNHAKVKLSGKVKTLRLDEVHTGVQFDAAQLTAAEVVVAGRLDNHARVKLNAPQGTVEFRNQVLGNAHLDVTAPGGKVTFLDGKQGKPANRIDGGARVNITAKEATFGGVISGGGTQVVVAFTDGGTLRYREVAADGRLQYRKADPNSSDPVVEAGVIKGRAKVEKIK